MRAAGNDEFRAGDHIRLSLTTDEEVIEARDIVQSLKTSLVNVKVETKRPVERARARVELKSTMECTAEQQFKLFAAHRQLDVDDAAFSCVIEAIQTSRVRGSVVGGGQRNIILSQIRMVNFGPFQGKTRFRLDPVNGNILILARAMFHSPANTIEEDLNRSNGSGKSMLLAGSLMWVLTGHIDARHLTFGDTAGIIHKGCLAATVELVGTINGEAFCIRREHKKKRIEAKSTTTLSLFVGDDMQDVTAATISATQADITKRIVGQTRLTLKQWLIGAVLKQQQSSLGAFTTCSTADAKLILDDLTDDNLCVWQSVESVIQADLATVQTKLNQSRENLVQWEREDADVAKRIQMNDAKHQDWVTALSNQIATVSLDITKQRQVCRIFCLDFS